MRMKLVLLLILLLTSICTGSDQRGPSDVLKETWSQTYTLLHKHSSPRCFRSCDQGAVNVFWNDIWGHDVYISTKSKFLESLTGEYTKNKEAFVNSFRKNITLGVLYLDADHNEFISAEEFYVEYLCLGFGIERTKQAFGVHHPGDDGIPVYDHIASLVQYGTGANETNEMYRLFEEIEHNLSSNAE